MNPTPNRRRQLQAGFTLVEIMVVIVILGLLATMVARNVIGMSEDAKLQKAKTDVTSIHDAAKLYYVYNSSIPTLEQLTTPDEKGRVAIDMLVADPWDQEYVIRELERNEFEVISFGPDEEEGTEDDITSRPDRER